MTTSIISVDATTSKIQVGGVDAIVFDATGITVGAGRRVAQIQTFQTGAVATGTTLIPFDNTIPQSTEGDQYMSLAFTPQNASSTLEIEVLWNGSNNGAGGFYMAAALFQDSTANALCVASTSTFQANAPIALPFRHVMTAGTTSATTFKVRAGAINVGTTTFNGFNAGQLFGGVMASRITITEYLP